MSTLRTCPCGCLFFCNRQSDLTHCKSCRGKLCISNKRTNRKWTESEKAIMNRMFQEGITQKDIGRAINRSTSAINNALLKDGKKRRNAIVPWTKQEDKTLKDMWAQDKSPDEISKVLYHRSAKAVACRASNIKLQRSPNRQKHAEKQNWTNGDIKLLQDLFPNTAADEIARILDRTIPAVNMKAYHLWGNKCQKKSQKQVWQEPD